MFKSVFSVKKKKEPVSSPSGIRGFGTLSQVTTCRTTQTSQLMVGDQKTK